MSSAAQAAEGTLRAPANGLTDRYKKVLCLLGDGRERLEDDVPVLRVYPQRPRRVVRLEV
jgi:hypothetical protein